MSPTTPTSVELVCDGLLLELVTTGAAVRRLVVTDDDGDTNVVLGHHDPRTYAANVGYLGATVGRFGNRLTRARFTLDGVEHVITANEGANALHGGLDGFDRREWTVEERGSSHVRLGLLSPDGDQGFPGALRVSVTYTLEPGLVRLDYRATTDADTVVSLTNHTYWNLDGEASGPIDAHDLQVSAEAFTPTDAQLLPTGELRDVDGTPFDLRRPARLQEALAGDDEQLRFGGGFDHNFAVSGTGLRHVASLRGSSGRRLQVESDRPGVQVYTGAHFDGTVLGTSGTAYGPRAGIALETQGYPDAPNHPGFPSALLRAGDTWSSTTVWRVDRDRG